MNNMFEDAYIHIDNIIALLNNRGLLDIKQKDEFKEQFDAQKQSGLVQIKLKPIPGSNPLNTLSKSHNEVINRFCFNIKGTIGDKVSYTINNPLFLYVFPFINKTVNVQFKRIVESQNADLVIVFADDQCIKSFKKILIKEEQKPVTTRRFDLIHFDTVLLNLLKNKHSSDYQLIQKQALEDLCNFNHVNPLYLHKIYVHDPVILYHGFNPFTVVQESFLSDVTAGISSQYLLIIPISTEQDVYNQFTYFL